MAQDGQWLEFARDAHIGCRWNHAEHAAAQPLAEFRWREELDEGCLGGSPDGVKGTGVQTCALPICSNSPATHISAAGGTTPSTPQPSRLPNSDGERNSMKGVLLTTTAPTASGRDVMDRRSVIFASAA